MNIHYVRPCAVLAYVVALCTTYIWLSRAAHAGAETASTSAPDPVVPSASTSASTSAPQRTTTPSTNEEKSPAPDLSSPQATVKSFTDALNKSELGNLVTCVYGTKPLSEEANKKLTARWKAQVTKGLNFGQVKVSNFKVFIHTKPVRVQSQLQYLDNGRVVHVLSNLDMIHEKSGWKIVPGSREVIQQVVRQQYLLRYEEDGVEEVSAQPRVVPVDVLLIVATGVSEIAGDPLKLPEADLRVQATNNLLYVASTAMQFSQEWDEAFAFNQSNYIDKLKVYANGDTQIFYDLKTQRPFAMNREMEGIELAKIEAPAETVLFYTGRNGQLEYPYMGTALVSFADGHDQNYRPDQVAKLRWKP